MAIFDLYSTKWGAHDTHEINKGILKEMMREDGSLARLKGGFFVFFDFSHFGTRTPHKMGGTNSTGLAGYKHTPLKAETVSKPHCCAQQS